MEEKKVQVVWRLCKADGVVEREEKQELTVPALSSVWTGKTEFPEADIHEEYVSYELLEKGETISYGSVLFCAPKHFHFRNPAHERSVSFPVIYQRCHYEGARSGYHELHDEERADAGLLRRSGF